MNKKFRRKIDGILLLDKPIGLTSNAALQKVKALFQARKAGHTGSLDPLATGMLPLCFGEATKFSQFLLEADKVYTVTAKLGVTTETGDAEGKVVAEKPAPKLKKSALKKVLEKFTGDIEQIPSMYSAIKYHGEPLYKLARQGITVERPARTVTIYELKLLEIGEDFLRLKVHCSKGTYVRTLVEDIGNELECGAHVSALRRSQVGPFTEDEMVQMETLEKLVDEKEFVALDKLLLPISTMLSKYPVLEINATMAHYMRQGQPVIIAGAPTSGLVILKLKTGQFLGVGEIAEDGKVAPRRLLRM